MSRFFAGLSWVYAYYDPVMLRVLPFALVALLLLLGALRGPAPPATAAGVVKAANCRFLVVCSACGRRERLVRAPARVLVPAGRGYQCPACGQPTARAYRFGGQVVPPGGW